MPARPMCPSRSSRSGVASGGPRPSSPHQQPDAGRRRRDEVDLDAAARRRAAARSTAPPAARGTGPARPPSTAAEAPRGPRRRSGCRCGRRSRPPASGAPGGRPEVVEQRRPQVVGDAADAPDAGVDQLEGVIEPLAPASGATPSRSRPSSILTAREHLRRLVVQLAREPAALLLVLLDHAGGEPGQLDRARLQAACRGRRSRARRRPAGRAPRGTGRRAR